MIIDALDNWKNYIFNERLKKAFEFLENKTSKDIKDGRYEIEGEDIYAIIQSYETKPGEGKLFESHCLYIDVQFMVSGQEIIEWFPIKALKVLTEYDSDKDVAFYNAIENASILKIYAGTFAVFYPEDGHMPGCLNGKVSNVKKIVVKVRIK